MYIVYERALCIIHKVMDLEKLSLISKDKNEVQFKHFKMLILSLFGNNIFYLSIMDIDSILRKVHKELLVTGQDVDATKPTAD